jgi:hypothetical protein
MVGYEHHIIFKDMFVFYIYVFVYDLLNVNVGGIVNLENKDERTATICNNICVFCVLY